MSAYTYQHDYSRHHPKIVADKARRTQKARKAIAVLTDFFGGPDELKKRHLLDLGCSGGHMTAAYGAVFARVTGVDIDAEAVAFAQANNGADNLRFMLGDSMNIPFADETFDAVSCTHIYEHVPDAVRLMAEINRVLKPGGICYFAAGNRLQLIEGHYRLPLLSVIPKWMAHKYLKVLGRGHEYYENHRTLWELRRLAGAFEIIDYTRRIVAEPERFAATDMITPGSPSQQAALMIMRVAYWLCPNYIWLLRKR